MKSANNGERGLVDRAAAKSRRQTAATTSCARSVAITDPCTLWALRMIRVYEAETIRVYEAETIKAYEAEIVAVRRIARSGGIARNRIV
jgi:hypothetical protein